MLGDATSAKADLAIGTRRELGIVRCDDQGEAAFGTHFVEEIEERLRRVRIETAGRLIGEEDSRTVDERAGERNALLLAGRELRRTVEGPIAQADPLEEWTRARLAGRFGPAREDLRERHILDRREVRQESERLEHEADRFAPVSREFIR